MFSLKEFLILFYTRATWLMRLSKRWVFINALCAMSPNPHSANSAKAREKVASEGMLFLRTNPHIFRKGGGSPDTGRG